MRIVTIVNEVLHDLLRHTQTLAILLAALIAADFFVFTPTVTSNVVLEEPISSSAVTDAYTAAGAQPPQVVLDTLYALESTPTPTAASATIVSSGASGSASSQVARATSGASTSGAAPSSIYPMADICARSRATVEALGTDACTIGQPDLPLYERALCHFDEKDGLPLDSGQLNDAAARLGMAIFTRATVKLTNPGKATAAQNVNISVPDGYSLTSGRLPLSSLSAGQESNFTFETRPGALTSTKAAIVRNPTFTVKWDPTGPLDPQFTLRVVLAFVALLVVLGVLDAIQAIGANGQGQRHDEAPAEIQHESS